MCVSKVKPSQMSGYLRMQIDHDIKYSYFTIYSIIHIVVQWSDMRLLYYIVVILSAVALPRLLAQARSPFSTACITSFRASLTVARRTELLWC